MLKNKSIIALAIIISTGFLSAQFTEKRVKKAPSMNTLKESCCTAFGDVLHASAELFSSLANVQSQALKAVEAYAHGDKKGWCATASRETLSTCEKKLQSLHARIEILQQECKDTLRSLQAS